MMDHILVSVRIGNDDLDMELPVKMKARELLTQIVTNVRKHNAEITIGEGMTAIFCENKRIPDDKTLEECYIWDGAALEIR